MMKIALVATYTYPVGLGLRYISSFLKAQGRDVEVFFMRSKRDTAEPNFSSALLGELVDRLRRADLIGMSLMTGTFHRAVALTQAIRRSGLKTPIIWGGPHPTCAPEESLEAADMVCLGEGERVMVELTDALDEARDHTKVPSIAWRRNGQLVRNRIAPLHDDLDDYPFPDYDASSQWVAMGNRFERPTPANLRGALHRYRIQTTRGCPYQCTFCNNTAMLRLYKDHRTWVRRRSNENILKELDTIRNKYPTVEAVNIVDDLFFIRGAEELEDFSREYARRINLPIELDAFPNTITDRKLRALASLPVSLISMGIQSGSQETLRDIYHRPTPPHRVAKAMDLLAAHRMPAEYHYLTNNPFETDRSRIETLRFAANCHRGKAVLRIFPLQFYPGTPLYERARREKIIGSRHESAYHYTYTGKTHLRESRYFDTWLRVVLNLRNVGVPRWVVHALIDLVTSRVVRFALDRKWFSTVADGIYRGGRFVLHKLIYQPFVRPIQRLRRGRRREDKILHSRAVNKAQALPPKSPTPESKSACADARQAHKA